MKTFTWFEPDETVLTHGVEVTKFRHDPAFYIRQFSTNIYAMSRRFWKTENTDHNNYGQDMAVILHAELIRRNSIGAAHRVMLELFPPDDIPPSRDPALVAVLFDATPDDEMSVLFSVCPTTTSLHLLVQVGWREPAFFGDAVLFYDGVEIYVYEADLFRRWERVLDSFDFNPAFDADETD